MQQTWDEWVADVATGAARERRIAGVGANLRALSSTDWRQGARRFARNQRSAQSAPPLRTVVTERRAGSESRPAAPAQAEESHAVRRHLTVDGRLVRDEEGNERRRCCADGTAAGAPREEAGDEVTNGQHRVARYQPRSEHSPAPAPRGRSRCMLARRDWPAKMHGACPR
jgi:hypothetical protein